MLPPVEITPVILLQWTEKAKKANQSENIVSMVKKELQKGDIIILPNTDTSLLLLTARQEALEQQAQREELVKERRITASSSSKQEGGDVKVIMDPFTIANRDEFCVSYSTTSTTTRDSDGLFTAHERCHLVMELLDEIFVQDSNLADLLAERSSSASLSSPLSSSLSSLSSLSSDEISSLLPLRHVLQSHEWIDILTPLHNDELKAKVQHATFWPIHRMMPPIDEINDYYGPEIAYYFAFTGFLSCWLGALGILGLCCFLFRCYRGDTIDEDEYTPFYGLICYVWAVLLYRFWERKENTLAYEWGTFEVASDGENIAEDFSGGYHHSPRRRPEFKGILRPSPVTGAPELYYPGYKRKFKYLVSAVVTAIMLSIAFYTMILSLNLQGYIRRRVSTNPFYFPQFTNLSEPGAIMDAQSSWRSFIPVVIHALSIMTLNTIYRGIARRLTVWENHETQTAFENSLVLKRFLFEAFDCYIVLLYLAFYARDMERLRAELIAVFNIDSFRRLFTECILPMIFHYFDPVADNEHPQDLHLDEYESFDDYMEILIQFGYVTLFASAYPLASLLACAALWLEIRSDCYKLTYLCQKPAGERVSNIGMWKALLGFMVWFSCLTNCLLFGLTSNQMMHYMPAFYIHDGEGVTHMVQDKGWLVILVIFGLERVLIYFGLALHAAIPSLPEELVVRLRRRNYFRFQQQQRLLQRRKSKKE